MAGTSGTSGLGLLSSAYGDDDAVFVEGVLWSLTESYKPNVCTALWV